MKKYRISFVFPMFNEADNIENTISVATGLAKEICDDYEIIVSDDASTDNSAGIVEVLARQDGHIKLIRLKKNTKFGGALKAGLENASKELVLYMDSDLPVRQDDIKRMLELLDNADVVTAYSLAIKDASPKRIIMSKGYNFLVKLLFGLKLRDINSGIKIYRKKALEGLKLISKSPFIDAEIFSEIEKAGGKIRQYGLVFELRTKGRSTISRPAVVIRTFWDMIRYRFSK